MPNQNNTIWTDDMISALTEMWKTMSAGRIADEFATLFNINLTRNSVVGKLHRLGLTLDNKTVKRSKPHKSARPKVNKPVMRLVRTASKSNGLRLIETITSHQPVFQCVVEPLNRTLAELGPSECRYISNDPQDGALYCGHQIFNRSLCAAHFSRCYFTAEQRVRRAA